MLRAAGCKNPFALRWFLVCREDFIEAAGKHFTTWLSRQKRFSFFFERDIKFTKEKNDQKTKRATGLVDFKYVGFLALNDLKFSYLIVTEVETNSPRKANEKKAMGFQITLFDLIDSHK